MLAAYMKNIHDIILKEVPLGHLGLDDIHLKVEACGICGSDITAAIDGSEAYRAFGHEIAGTVLEIGQAVTNVRVGDKVVLESASACGRCSNCRNMKQELCQNIQSFWPRPPYGFAQEMIVPSISAIPYDGLTPEEASLSEPLGVALDMHRVAEIQVGSHVLVSGLGPIGLMAIRLAKLSGAEKIYACDLSGAKKRLELARAFGADEIIPVDQVSLETYAFPQPPDRLMVSSPPKTLAPMVKIAAPKAIISFIGIKYGPAGQVTFDANELHFKRIQLRGSFASPAMGTPQALHLLKQGIIGGNTLISQTFPLTELPRAMKMAVDDLEHTVKIIIKS
jgi:L-iditol 2-dehydrogenase